MVFILCIPIFPITASAKVYTHSDISEMSDYDYYITFAEALKNHDAETIALFIPCKDSSQFKYNGIEISDYSVKLLKKSRDEYSHIRKAARITFDIKKSNNSLFPKGKQDYYVHLEMDGAFGTFMFYPYSYSEKNISEKYSIGVLLSECVAVNLTDYKSASASKIKKMEYEYEFVHNFYHSYLQKKYPDGISKSNLTKELN